MSLDPGGIVAGRVLDDHGAPRAGVGVVLLIDQAQLDSARGLLNRRSASIPSDGFALSGVTDALGAVRIDRVPASRAIVAFVDDRIYARQFALEPGGRNESLEFTASRVVRVRGRAMLAPGVVASTGAVSRAVVGSDGSFSLVTAEGDGRLLCLDRPKEPRRWAMVDLRHDRLDEEFVFSPGREIAGIVVDQNGVPASNVALRARPTDFSTDDDSNAGVSGPDGRVTLHAPPGKDVRVSLGFFSSDSVAREIVVRADEANFRFAVVRRGLVPEGRIRVAVVDAASGVALSGRYSMWQDVRSGYTHTGSFQESIQLSIENGGRGRIFAMTPDHAPVWSDEFDVGAGGLRDDVLLRAPVGTKLTVHLVRASAASTGGLAVELHHVDDAFAWPLEFATTSAISDAAGSATFHHLRTGTYTVRVRIAAQLIERRVEIDESLPSTLDITFP